MGGKRTLTTNRTRLHSTNVIDASYLPPQTPAPRLVSMNFSLNHEGWASLAVRCGEQNFTIKDFGSGTDGLGDLVRTALTIAAGGMLGEVVFDCEPQVWGLAVQPAGLSPENVRVVRLTIRDGGTTLSDAGRSGLPVWAWSSSIVLDSYVTTDGFAAAVQGIASRARADFDDATYRTRWSYFGSLEGFPLRGLRALEAALSVPEYRE